MEGSRRYTDIKNYLFDDDHWEANKEKYYEQLNLPQDPRKFLDDLEQFFFTLSTQVDNNFPTNPWAEIVNGELKVKQVEAVNIPDEVEEEGELRRRDYETQMERMSCLSLLLNCIVTWNTYHIGKIIEQLRQKGYQITNDIIFHLSPLMHRHINPYGVYYFNIP